MLYIPMTLILELQEISETTKNLSVRGLIRSIQSEVLDCDYKNVFELLTFLEEEDPQLINYRNAEKQLRRAKTRYEKMPVIR